MVNGTVPGYVVVIVGRTAGDERAVTGLKIITADPEYGPLEPMN